MVFGSDIKKNRFVGGCVKYPLVAPGHVDGTAPVCGCAVASIPHCARTTSTETTVVRMACLLFCTKHTPLNARFFDWTGYAGVGDYARSNGNTYEVITAGHQIRDQVFSRNPREVTDTGEVFDCVIVGGGISGFAAALQLQRRSPGPKCLILENHAVFGGEAKRNEFLVDGQRLMAPQGSDHFSIPAPGSFMAKFYDSIGLDITKFQDQGWKGPSPRMPLGRTFEFIQEPYGIYFGAKFGQKPGMWLIDPWNK